MARTVIAPQNWPGSRAVTGTHVTFTQCDVSNKHAFALTGQETLLVRNTAATALTWTLSGTTDLYGRIQDAVGTVAAGSVDVFGPISNAASAGWRQTGGTAYLEGGGTLLYFAVLVLPTAW